MSDTFTTDMTSRIVSTVFTTIDSSCLFGSQGFKQLFLSLRVSFFIIISSREFNIRVMSIDEAWMFGFYIHLT
jgi:hypothetical protein